MRSFSRGNEVKDSYNALPLYRNNNMVEKTVGNLKERLYFRGKQVSSKLSLNGNFFISIDNSPI